MTIIDMDKMGEALNTKADIDLNNTGVFSTSEGGVVNLASSTPANASGKEVTSADFFQSNLLNYTTNRILEIPQDIKLELNNGTLTLKAGSKVYVPNGFEADGTTPKFDVITVQSDLLYTEPSTRAITALVFYNADKNLLMRRGINPESGSSVSSGFNSVFYNTSTNLCYNYASGTQGDKVSFPICICTSNGQSTNNISSIDQVFNGFGYIGSTVFALPGVKVQIPNGRNEDGTCNSVIIVNSKVNLWSATGTAYVDIVLLQNGIFGYTKTNLFYDSEKNLFKHKNGSIIYGTTIASCWNKDTVVSDFLRYDVDSVLNSSLSNLSAAGEAKLKSNIQLVNELPANPEPGVLYCIPEA